MIGIIHSSLELDVELYIVRGGTETVVKLTLFLELVDA